MAETDVPTCAECHCQTGGGAYCYEHKPYMVYPKADGSFIVDRFGRRHVTFDEPPQPDAVVPGSGDSHQ